LNVATFRRAPIAATAKPELGNMPMLTLRDAQAPGKDISSAEPEATLPRYRAPEILIVLN
jgi:hypothetical protein